MCKNGLDSRSKNGLTQPIPDHLSSSLTFFTIPVACPLRNQLSNKYTHKSSQRIDRIVRETTGSDWPAVPIRLRFDNQSHNYFMINVSLGPLASSLLSKIQSQFLKNLATFIMSHSRVFFKPALQKVLGNLLSRSAEVM